jgi:hypothetical protein
MAEELIFHLKAIYYDIVVTISANGKCIVKVVQFRTKMGYDSRAVKIHKMEKTMAILSFNKERERHLIREFVKVKQQSARTRSSRNKGEKEQE